MSCPVLTLGVQPLSRIAIFPNNRTDELHAAMNEWCCVGEAPHDFTTSGGSPLPEIIYIGIEYHIGVHHPANVELKSAAVCVVLLYCQGRELNTRLKHTLFATNDVLIEPASKQVF
jgi:hypothetical protein